MDIENLIKTWNDNFKQLALEDAKAKDLGLLVGRYIDEPIADGKAIYKIIKENKKTVRIKVVTGIGDDWTIPCWGKETTIDKDYAIRKLHSRDAIAKLFQKTN